MTTLTSTLPAHRLLDIFDSPTPPSDADANRAMTDFLSHIEAIHRAQKPKQWSERYLIEGVFGRSRKFNNNAERQAYCRVQLKIAIDEFKDLVKELRDPQTGALTFSALEPWKETIRDYVFDLSEIAPFLQRRVAGYIYLRGFKNSTVHSWEVYLLAKELAYQSAFWGKGRCLDHKAAQIAAIGVLRQALELRFTRLIAVYPTNKKGKPPKLRHGFHQDFVVANPTLFRARGFSIADLRPMYDWCSEIVHQAYQPYAWQISWAHKLSGRLLASRAAPSNAAWSIANAVEISDIPGMQAAFERYFLANYHHGAWQMTRHRPEALTPSWKAAMGGTSQYFNVPDRRKPAWKLWLIRRLNL
ncbi:hypothetical protein [Parasphingorhabdus sp.]|uniref:hypothetical protein n=1 Tax=Parasphingorhabdus sp. TaxID=2709688 RepID=UPI003A940230